MQVDASALVSGTASFTLAASVVASNTASAEGGGIGSGGSLTVTNSTFSGNSAATGGGLIASQFLSLDHVTISGNNASDSGGAALGGTTGVVRNTIIAGNVDTAGGETPDCGGTIQSGDYNLIGNDSGCAFIGPTTHTLRNVAALLGPLQNNGGTTVGAQLTHALLSGSPARSAADPTNCPATDQRGVPRALGGPCDIGAFEADVEFRLFLPLVLR
jgi:predicted outer membrane repeat protein